MPRNYRNLKRAKIRPDWNKYTLFNLSRLQAPNLVRPTFFQQKWQAKSALRAYHSPYVREGYWERLFDRRLPGVVAMDYRYLARHDGSELASGRGAGLVTEENGQIVEQQGLSGTKKLSRTPYMSMTFFPLERRLDTAIWRALFASSARQARQMVVHGSVKVNGKKMIHPGYLLNPGDMFSIDPDKVMYATGERKQKKDSNFAWTQRNTIVQHPLAKSRTEQTSGEQRRTKKNATSEKRVDKELEVNEASEDSIVTAKAAAHSTASTSTDKPSDETLSLRSRFKQLRAQARQILDEGKTDLSGKRLSQLRDFARSVQTAMSKFGGKADQEQQEAGNVTAEELEKVFSEIFATLPDAALPADQAQARKEVAATEEKKEFDARKDAELLIAAMERVRENPIDASKPYATPWRPRPYMSVFAFIPRYLEVNQNICSAVYIRHPVARPGLAEVPSPFAYDTSQLGFNWYLRRR